MSTADQELLSAFDGHDVEGVRAALEAGANPCEPIRGKLPVDWLLEEYSRSGYRTGAHERCGRDQGCRDGNSVTTATQNQNDFCVHLA